MKFNPDFTRSFDLKEAHGTVAVIAHFRVGGVVTDNHVIFICKFDDALKESLISDCGGGIVGIVDPKESGLPGDLRRDRLQVMQKSMFLFSRQKVVFASAEFGSDMVNGVTEARDQH